jgi:thymidylate synthase (FAD)
MENNVKVLDKGYVKLVTWLPWNMVELQEAIEKGDLEKAQSLIGSDDLNTVNAAKASFKKTSTSYGKSESRLVDYLARNHESSPFRHNIVAFEIYAPIFTARQWFKYRVGSEHSEDSEQPIGLGYYGQGDQGGFGDTMDAWNEASRRYVTMEPEFYVPEVWREAPDNKKQGSAGDLPTTDSQNMSEILANYQQEGIDLYNHYNNIEGVAPEMTRLFLPAYGMYISWRWTASLVSVCHFLKERLEEKAQSEIRDYAQAIHTLLLQVYPEGTQKLLEY